MGLGEGQRHSRSLQVYNMHNVPSRSDYLALRCLSNEEKLSELYTSTWHTCGHHHVGWMLGYGG